jgi:pyruvate dehydrogenase complex dehydrogenase (E1) component
MDLGSVRHLRDRFNLPVTDEQKKVDAEQAESLKVIPLVKECSKDDRSFFAGIC